MKHWSIGPYQQDQHRHVMIDCPVTRMLHRCQFPFISPRDDSIGTWRRHPTNDHCLLASLSGDRFPLRCVERTIAPCVQHTTVYDCVVILRLH